MIAAVDHGGSGPTVVLVHGAGGSAADWAAIAPRLAESHHVVTIDLPGHGRSPAPTASWTFSLALDELAALELNNPAVVGMSLGGMLAVHWGHAHPECPAVVSLDGHRPALTGAQNYRGMADTDVSSARARLGALFTTMIQTADPVQERVQAGVFDAMQADDTVPLLATIRCPTLMALATRPMPGAEAFDELFAAFRRGLDYDLGAAALVNPRLTVTRLDASHAMLLEIPDQLVILIRNHLTA